MGWFSDVADILEQRGYFQLVTHDGTRFREVDELESERDALKAENVRLGHYAILLEGALLRRCAGAYKDIDNAKTISRVDWSAMHITDIERRRTE